MMHVQRIQISSRGFGTIHNNAVKKVMHLGLKYQTCLSWPYFMCNITHSRLLSMDFRSNMGALLLSFQLP